MSKLADFATHEAPDEPVQGSGQGASPHEADACLVRSNIDGLAEGRSLLERLSDAQYMANAEPAFISTIGAHFRHVLEHYQCLFAQLTGQQISYDERPRCIELEQSRVEALSQIEALIQRLGALTRDDFAAPCQVFDQQTTAPLPTTLARELLFLQSHTVHHYAMVAAIARMLGVQTDQDFGVAIATRTFYREQEDTQRDASDDAGAGNGEQPCAP